MNTNSKGILLVVGAYIVTMGVALLIVTLAIMILLMESPNCSTMGQALLVLWATIAAVFIASVVVVGLVAKKFLSDVTGRRVIVAAYGVAMLASFVVIAFGLMVLFNC